MFICLWEHAYSRPFSRSQGHPEISRVCDGGLLEGGSGLHEHATVDGGTTDKRGRSGTQDDTLKVKIGAIGGFPGQENHVARPDDITCDLEDPCVCRGTAQGAVLVEVDASAICSGQEQASRPQARRTCTTHSRN